MHVNQFLHITSEHVVEKTKLIMPLFIVCVTVKALLKSYTVVQKQSISVTNVGMAHAHWAFINTLGLKFQWGPWGCPIVQ